MGHRLSALQQKLNLTKLPELYWAVEGWSWPSKRATQVKKYVWTIFRTGTLTDTPRVVFKTSWIQLFLAFHTRKRLLLPLQRHMYQLKGAHSHAITYLEGWSVPVLNLGCSSLVGCGSMAMWNVSYWMFCITALWSMKPFVPAAWCQTCFNSYTALYRKEKSKRKRKTHRLSLHPLSPGSTGSFCTQPPIIQMCWASSECMERRWLNLPTARYSVLADWSNSHNS